MRIGPQMQAAVAYVSRHPGCCIRDVASDIHIAARTGRNNALGYDPVHRAIKAGLITAIRAAGRYSLTVSATSLNWSAP